MTIPQRYELRQSFFFDAAHTLKRQIEADASRRIHGHTYHVDVYVSGPKDPATGMVVDLGFVRAAIARLATGSTTGCSTRSRGWGRRHWRTSARSSGRRSTARSRPCRPSLSAVRGLPTGARCAGEPTDHRLRVVQPGVAFAPFVAMAQQGDG